VATKISKENLILAKEISYL